VTHLSEAHAHRKRTEAGDDQAPDHGNGAAGSENERQAGVRCGCSVLTMRTCCQLTG
jgi:hypothetical protein